MAAARADTRTAAKPTADQMRVLEILEQLAGAADRRGVAAQALRTMVLAARFPRHWPCPVVRAAGTPPRQARITAQQSPRATNHQCSHPALDDLGCSWCVGVAAAAGATRVDSLPEW